MDSSEIQANREAQAEELEALLAIYGPDQCCVDSETMTLEVRLEACAAAVKALLPMEYPSRAPPLLELHDPQAQLSPSTLDLLLAEAERMHTSSPGQVMMFDLLEWLRELVRAGEEGAREEADAALAAAAQEHEDAVAAQLEACALVDAASLQADLDQQAARDAHNQQRQEQDLAEAAAIARAGEGVVHGATCTEKKSVFQAHVAPAVAVEDVRAVVAALMQNRKVQAATHNIMAYRISQPGGVWVQDFDDDGESAAGGRLLHLLQMTNAVNVVVVVSRWYGGVKLGPDRFKLINNTARTLLEATGYIKPKGGGRRA